MAGSLWRISQEEGEGAPGMEETSYNPLGERPLQSKSPAGKEKVSRLFIQDVFYVRHPAEALLYSSRDGAA